VGLAFGLAFALAFSFASPFAQLIASTAFWSKCAKGHLSPCLHSPFKKKRQYAGTGDGVRSLGPPPILNNSG
jgi:hypothetical protein